MRPKHNKDVALVYFFFNLYSKIISLCACNLVVVSKSFPKLAVYRFSKFGVIFSAHR